MITTINGAELELSFAHNPQYYGAYSIMITAQNGTRGEVFRVRTTDMQLIDKINDMKADEAKPSEVEQVYFSHVTAISNIEEIISEWVDKCDMLEIMEAANDRLEESVFDFDPSYGNVYNYTNRYEGNDLDLNKEYGLYILRITGSKYEYHTKQEAIQGLIDLYSAD